jgi:hypothetical protein
MRGRIASCPTNGVEHDAKNKKTPKKSAFRAKPAEKERVTIIPDSDAGLRLLDVLERIANETGSLENSPEKSA